MTPHLPPLHTLRAFEVAARLLNFSRAAAELNLTHGAISHQMKALERELGVTLFERRSRGVALTEPGRQLAAAVREGLDRIARGVAGLRVHPARSLTVSVLPAFATHWLIPRLADFSRRHPDIDINVRAGQALADFATDEVDLAVRYGDGHWPNVVAVQLAHEDVFAVCSPRFADGRLPGSLAELATATLLHTPLQPWEEWFRALGVGFVPSRRAMTFSETDLLLRAAIDGLGIALSRRMLAQPDLDAGQLVRPVQFSVRAQRSYYIVYPDHIEPPLRLLTFRDWLLEQAQATIGPPHGNRAPARAVIPAQAGTRSST
jgi:LysR family transcriptional regulator, glycine cleavage system transcriptional activator